MVCLGTASRKQQFLNVVPASDNTDPKKPEAAQPTVQMTTETNHGRHQRHSLIGLFTGDHGSKGSAEHPHTTLPTKGIFWFE
jgi:hypothetical protein